MVIGTESPRSSRKYKFVKQFPPQVVAVAMLEQPEVGLHAGVHLVKADLAPGIGPLKIFQAPLHFEGRSLAEIEKPPFGSLSVILAYYAFL
jgi:hypothetical protein